MKVFINEGGSLSWVVGRYPTKGDLKMEDRIYAGSELANIIAIGIDRTSLSAWPMVTPPYSAAEFEDFRTSGHAAGRDLAEFAGPRRGIRTAWGYVTAEMREDSSLRSLKIRLENDPWFRDSASAPAGNGQAEAGIYLSDIAQRDLERAIGDDIDALEEAGAAWTDIGSVYVIGEFYILEGASLGEVGAILADVFRRVDVAALVVKSKLEAADGGVEV